MIVKFRKKELFEVRDWVGYLFFGCLFFSIWCLVTFVILEPEEVCFVTDLSTGETVIKNASFCLNQTLAPATENIYESNTIDIYKITLPQRTPIQE